MNDDPWSDLRADCRLAGPAALSCGAAATALQWLYECQLASGKTVGVPAPLGFHHPWAWIWIIPIPVLLLAPAVWLMKRRDSDTGGSSALTAHPAASARRAIAIAIAHALVGCATVVCAVVDIPRLGTFSSPVTQLPATLSFALSIGSTILVASLSVRRLFRRATRTPGFERASIALAVSFCVFSVGIKAFGLHVGPSRFWS